MRRYKTKYAAYQAKSENETAVKYDGGWAVLTEPEHKAYLKAKRNDKKKKK